MRQWFVAQLTDAGEPCEMINAFLNSGEASGSGFWMTHFTAADMKNPATTKAQKVFKIWQKSH
jgi:hypothetical protein